MSAMVMVQSETPIWNHSMCAWIRPRSSSAWLIAPFDGLKRKRHSTPTIEGGSIMGITRMTRITSLAALLRTQWCRMSASAVPITT